MANPKLIFFLSNTSLMMSALFIPNYTLALGGGMLEIGLVGSAYGFSIFFSSYFFGRASDSMGRKTFIVSGLLVSAIAFLLQVAAKTPIQLLAVRALAGFSLGIFTAPLVAYAHERDGRMGTFSSYGSMGWAVGCLLAGVIAEFGENFAGPGALIPFWSIFILSSLIFFASFFCVLSLKEAKFHSRPLPLFPFKLFMENVRVYISFFLRCLGGFSIWVIFPLYLEGIGANKFWIGALYFINTGSQIFIMRRLDSMDETKLIKYGLILSTLVFFSYSLAPNFRWIIPIQILLAFSFSFLYVGNLTYLAKRNKEKAASVGLLNSMMGICIGLGPLLGGLVSGSFGFKGVIYFGAILAFSGFLVMKVGKNCR